MLTLRTLSTVRSALRFCLVPAAIFEEPILRTPCEKVLMEQRPNYEFYYGINREEYDIIEVALVAA